MIQVKFANVSSSQSHSMESEMKHSTSILSDSSMVNCFSETETQSERLRQHKSEFDTLIEHLHSSDFVKHMRELRASVIA